MRSATTPWSPGGARGRGDTVVESIHAGRGSPHGRPTREAEPRRPTPFSLSSEEVGAIDNQVERLALVFVNNVLGEDRRRVQRRLNGPLLFSHQRLYAAERGTETRLDERAREDHAALMAEEGAGLLSKPLRKALRDSTVLRDLELMLDTFKADNVPFSGAYEEKRGGSRHYGRVSIRVRASDLNDPLELTYVRGPWRIGSDQDRLKAGYSTHLTEALAVAIRSNYYYDEDLIHWWGDLHYELSSDTHCHLLVGDRVDLYTGTRKYPIVQSPVVLQSSDESPGFLFYVEHLF